jgi:hypothetical protein
VDLNGGGIFWSGARNVAVAYRAGYQVTDEEGTIPALTPFTITPIQPFGSWATDEGVTYADGTALVAIASGTPTVGQYLPPNPTAATPRNHYTFATADAGEEVLLSYGFIPADLEQVILGMIAEQAAYRNRPGVRSQMLASQETIVYDTSGMTAFSRSILSAYKSVLPPAMGAVV